MGFERWQQEMIFKYIKQGTPTSVVAKLLMCNEDEIKSFLEDYNEND